jgi:hypothetical protein
VVGFAIFIYNTNKKIAINREVLNKSFRYMVGITDGKVKNIRSSGPDLKYKFWIGGVMYINSRRFRDDGTIKYKVQNIM